MTLWILRSVTDVKIGYLQNHQIYGVQKLVILSKFIRLGNKYCTKWRKMRSDSVDPIWPWCLLVHYKSVGRVIASVRSDYQSRSFAHTACSCFTRESFPDLVIWLGRSRSQTVYRESYGCVFGHDNGWFFVWVHVWTPSPMITGLTARGDRTFLLKTCQIRKDE